MEVAAGRSLSTCCTCLRRVDTDGRVQCAECLDKSIMRACARRSGGRGNALFSSSSSSSASSCSQRFDPRLSSSSSSSVTFSSASSSSSSSCNTCPAGGRDPCPHENPFASAVRYLPFPGRPRVVIIKNRDQAPAAAPPSKGNYPRNPAAASAAGGGSCAASTRLAPTACPEVAVPRDTLRLNNGGGGQHQHQASGERGGGGNAVGGGAGKPSARSGHGGGGGGDEVVVKRTIAAADSATPGEVAMAISLAKTKTKATPSLSKAVSMVDRTAAAMMSAAEQARSEPTAAMKKVRLRHSRGGGSISSFMTVGGADAGFLDEILSSFSAPCSPGDRKGEERGSSKQGGSTSPLWERRCFTRPAMLEINSVAVPV